MEKLIITPKTKIYDLLEVIAPFIPAPLIDKSLSLDIRHWLDKKSDSEYRVYFTS